MPKKDSIPKKSTTPKTKPTVKPKKKNFQKDDLRIPIETSITVIEGQLLILHCGVMECDEHGSQCHCPDVTHYFNVGKDGALTEFQYDAEPKPKPKPKK